MGKKSWIILVCIAIAIISIVLVLLLFLIPKTESSKVDTSTYKSINKSDYIYSSTKETVTLEQKYSITEEDITSGIKSKTFVEGNINPFSPSGDVTIYNEPTKSLPKTGSLTPSSK